MTRTQALNLESGEEAEIPEKEGTSMTYGMSLPIRVLWQNEGYDCTNHHSRETKSTKVDGCCI